MKPKIILAGIGGAALVLAVLVVAEYLDWWRAEEEAAEMPWDVGDDDEHEHGWDPLNPDGNRYHCNKCVQVLVNLARETRNDNE